MRIGPVNTSGDGIQSDDIVRCLYGVQDSVNYQRCGLEFLDRTGLPDPLLLEVFDVRRRDLIERRIALIHDGSRVSEPVLRFGGGVEDSVESDLSPEAACHQNE